MLIVMVMYGRVCLEVGGAVSMGVVRYFKGLCRGCVGL